MNRQSAGRVPGVEAGLPSVALVALVLFCAGYGLNSSALARQGTRTPRAQTNRPTAAPPEAEAARTSYRINLKLDFDGRGYSGTERVRWVNRDDRAAFVLYFHLYPNQRNDINNGRATPAAAAANGAGSGAAELAAADEPRLEVTEVRAAA
ncbi:MAG: hypothetical protein ACRD68_15655, partial [Pyrinomonadaceae bacterium]